MPEPRDTGDLLEVPDDQQLDHDPDPDTDPSHAALVDHDDPGGDDDLDDVYADPGQVIEEDLG